MPGLPKRQCRHCSRHVCCRSRGLCSRCWNVSTVRLLFPATGNTGRRGVTKTSGRMPRPTAALPGTPEKVAVLESRAAAGQRLHHPRDARRGVA